MQKPVTELCEFWNAGNRTRYSSARFWCTDIRTSDVSTEQAVEHPNVSCSLLKYAQNVNNAACLAAFQLFQLTTLRQNTDRCDSRNSVQLTFSLVRLSIRTTKSPSSRGQRAKTRLYTNENGSSTPISLYIYSEIAKYKRQLLGTSHLFRATLSFVLPVAFRNKCSGCCLHINHYVAFADACFEFANAGGSEEAQHNSGLANVHKILVLHRQQAFRGSYLKNQWRHVSLFTIFSRSLRVGLILTSICKNKILEKNQNRIGTWLVQKKKQTFGSIRKDF